MKQYRASLEVAASPTVSGRRVADLFGLPSSAFTRLQAGRQLRWRHWRYQPHAEYSDRLVGAVRLVGARIGPRHLLPPDCGVGTISFDVAVRYDTVTCTVSLPGPLFDALGARISELTRVRILGDWCDCDLVPADDGDRTDSDMAARQLPALHAEWVAAGRPETPRARAPLAMPRPRPSPIVGRRRRGGVTANEYAVSLDALTSPSVTASEVGEALGLPPVAFVRHDREDGALWSCEIEADDAEGLGSQIRFLAAAIHARRLPPRGRKLKAAYLDIAVFFDERQNYSVDLPMLALRALMRKLPHLDGVEVTCYPCARDHANP